MVFALNGLGGGSLLAGSGLLATLLFSLEAGLLTALPLLFPLEALLLFFLFLLFGLALFFGLFLSLGFGSTLLLGSTLAGTFLHCLSLLLLAGEAPALLLADNGLGGLLGVE